MFLAIGILLIAIAFFLRYRIGRRQYYRRTKPVSKVPAYSKMLGTRFIEDIGTFIYYLLFIVGFLVIIACLCTNGLHWK